MTKESSWSQWKSWTFVDEQFSVNVYRYRISRLLYLEGSHCFWRRTTRLWKFSLQKLSLPRPIRRHSSKHILHGARRCISAERHWSGESYCRSRNSTAVRQRRFSPCDRRRPRTSCTYDRCRLNSRTVRLYTVKRFFFCSRQNIFSKNIHNFFRVNWQIYWLSIITVYNLTEKIIEILKKK